MGEATIPRMSPNTSWIFPGQGSQSVGMGAAALAASHAARAVLAEAEAALGEPLGQLMATGPVEALERTEVAQPAILTISIALLAAARERAAAAGNMINPTAINVPRAWKPATRFSTTSARKMSGVILPMGDI